MVIIPFLLCYIENLSYLETQPEKTLVSFQN